MITTKPYFSDEAIPLGQEPMVTKIVCPPNENYDECFSVDFPGTSNDHIILLKETSGPTLLLGHLQSKPNTRVVALRKSASDDVVEVNL